MGNQETQLLIKADLFIKANNNVENAKNLFKECKRTIDESYVVLGSSLFSQLKNQITDSDKYITNLIARIENTKQSLMELNQEFANEYMTILADQLKIDTSKMTELERNVYNQKMNSTIKDYNFNLFYMLERLQKNGQLTPEIEKMIEQEYGINYNYQKAVCEQYKIQDQMSGVDVLSDEFKSLYKEYIEQGKNVILFDPKLDEDTKQIRLNELETQYNETIKSIDESQKARTQARQQEQLQKLQLQKEYNNGFFHPGVEKEIDDAIINLRAEMGDQSAIEYLNMSDFEKGLQYAGTVCLSTFEGFLDLGEGLIIDGAVYLAGKVVQVGSFGHVDDKWAEDIISYDVSGNLYDWTVDAIGINSNIAYGSARSIGNFIGGGLGYYALSAVPYVGPFLCALAGAGKKTEENMIYQLETTGEIDDGKVLLNFALGAAEGYGAGKAAGSMREGVKNLSQLKGVLGKDGFKATMASAGDIAEKAAIRTFTDVDTWIETAAVIADDIYTGFETGEWNWGQMFFEASGVIEQNFIGNFGVEAMGNYQKQLASQKVDWNNNLDAMTPEQRSKYWEDYFNSQYGADNVTKTSGIDVEGHNGSFVESMDSKEYFKSVATVLGITDQLSTRYFDILDSDIKWKSQEMQAKVTAKEAGYEWDKLSKKQQADYIKNASHEEFYEVAKKEVIYHASETMTEYKLKYDSGKYFEFGITLEEVFEYKIKAKEMSTALKNGTITQQNYDEFLSDMKKDYSGIKYGEYLPSADKFISDDRVLEYTKSLFPDNRQIASATNLEELALAIKETNPSIKMVSFQDASLGANNVVTYNAFGHTSLQQGGAFVVPESALQGYATKYPEYCTYENGEFTILDYEKFGSEVLSGVPLTAHNGVYLVKTNVPVNGQNLSMPSVLNSSSYADFFVSGGELLSGEIEATIDPIKGIIADGNAHVDIDTGIGYEIVKYGGTK